jgi:hypothetical protein
MKLPPIESGQNFSRLCSLTLEYKDQDMALAIFAPSLGVPGPRQYEPGHDCSTEPTQECSLHSKVVKFLKHTKTIDIVPQQERYSEAQLLRNLSRAFLKLQSRQQRLAIIRLIEAHVQSQA